MSAASDPAPVAVRQTSLRQDGEPSNANSSHDSGDAVGEMASNTRDPRMLQHPSRTMSSGIATGKTISSRHTAADGIHSSQNDFRGRGTSWATICIALCAVTGFTFAYFYSAEFKWQAAFVWALISATILRTVGLCAVMVPALFHRTGFRSERRRTFIFICLLSLVSVIAAWILWRLRSPKWPQVLLIVSDVFSAIAGAQLVISGAYEDTAHHDDIGLERRPTDLEAY
ncbi:hypothetical protein N431DRAFT_442540 [Stipitochalara longipes BDJ]|nr:hypothetical protein N431DRAFT_442540 [Stipitochalara longipes BDJ]